MDFYQKYLCKFMKNIVFTVNVDLKGEDPDADYNAVIECIIEDLNQ